MVTLSQLNRRPRKQKKAYCKSPSLNKCPQKRGICIRLLIRSPKKPNSAKRKAVRVVLSTGKRVTAYIPGEGHTLQEHSCILVRGGRVQDVPGIRYHAVRGALDFRGLLSRKTKRSKYGSPLKKL